MAAQLADLQRRRLQSLRLGVPTLAASENQRQAALLGLDPSLFNWLQPCIDGDACGSTAPPPRLLRTLALARATSRAVLRASEAAAISRASAEDSAGTCAPLAADTEGTVTADTSPSEKLSWATTFPTSQATQYVVSATNRTNRTLTSTQTSANPVPGSETIARSPPPADIAAGRDSTCPPSAIQAQQPLHGSCTTTEESPATCTCGPQTAARGTQEGSNRPRGGAVHQVSCGQRAAVTAVSSAGRVDAALKAGAAGGPSAATSGRKQAGNMGGEHRNTTAPGGGGGTESGNVSAAAVAVGAGAAGGLNDGRTAARQRGGSVRKAERPQRGSASVVTSAGVARPGKGEEVLMVRVKSPTYPPLVVYAHLLVIFFLVFHLILSLNWHESPVIDAWLMFAMTVFLIAGTFYLVVLAIVVSRTKAEASEAALPDARGSRKGVRR